MINGVHMRIEIYHGDCLKRLKDIPSESVNSCVTSPPYWGLRNYNDEEDQLGQESTPELFVSNLVYVFREIYRILRKDGTLWLNLGDSYAEQSGSGFNTNREQGYTNRVQNMQSEYGDIKVKTGLPRKNLLGMPWRVALALQADGWILRQDIIWHKPNPMPESVTDRCTKAHEYIFLFSKSQKYYYDNESIKEQAKYPDGPDSPDKLKKGINEKGFEIRSGMQNITGMDKRNKRSVWTVTTKPYAKAHFATYPPDLIEPCILAGVPEKVCIKCREPYIRKIDKKRIKRSELEKGDPRYRPNDYDSEYKDINGKKDAGYTITKDLGLEKQCDCDTEETDGGTVIDPFGGSGTTALVADRYERNSILVELNEEYIELAKERIMPNTQSLFHHTSIIDK